MCLFSVGHRGDFEALLGFTIHHECWSHVLLSIGRIRLLTAAEIMRRDNTEYKKNVIVDTCGGIRPVKALSESRLLKKLV